MIASGVLQTPHFTMDSQDGYFRIEQPNRFTIIGNATFTERSTVFLTINGTKLNQFDRLNITGSFQINSLTLLRPGLDSNNKLYTPKIDDMIPFATFESGVSFVKTINLFGAPYKNAEYVFQGQQGYLKIVFSFGSLQNDGYRCSYLGNQKILEINVFDKPNKIVLSLTTPPRDSSWIGFGFDFNGTTQDSIFAHVKDTNIFEMTNHKTLGPLNHFLNVESSISQTIFLIGPEYRTINLLFSLDLLKSQNHIYYSEIPAVSTGNGTFITDNVSSHYFERFEFSVLRSDTVNCTTFLQPLRAETYQLGVSITMIFLYCGLFLLCMLFYRKRPMNSRGISPFLTIFFLLLQLLLELKNYTEIPVFQGSLCFYYSFGVYPLHQLCFIMILLYFIRYFSVININSSKKNIYTQLVKGDQIHVFQRVKMRILKVLVSPWITLTLLVGSYLVVTFVFFIILAKDSFVCKFDTLISLRGVNNAELIVIYCLTVLTLISDMIGNYVILLRGRVLHYLFESDPYWFRAQLVLFFPFMIYTLIVEIHQFFISLTFLGVVQNHWTVIWTNTVTYSILLIIEVVFPLLITIITFIRALIKERGGKSKGSIEIILENPETSKLFVEFCQIEFSLENISSYNDIQLFKKNVSIDAAKDFYEKYLNGNDSVMEINVQRKVCIQVQNKIKEGSVDSALFDQIATDLMSNLCDTYSRFVMWSEYETYLNNIKSQKEMIEGINK